MFTARTVRTARALASSRLANSRLASTRMASSERVEELVASFKAVQHQIHDIASSANVPQPTLVAVSKYKPAEDIQALYDAGQRHFGENYVQELLDKVEALPKDIKWHFIGSLQSNKCKVLGPIESLYAVETLDSESKAQKLHNARKGEPLHVFIQVNTSGEEQKSGLTDEAEILKLAQFITDKCTNLHLDGLMTIGSVASSTSEGKNADFKRLAELGASLSKTIGRSLQLSMGMSTDFAQAIRQGSTNVRVGSSIFGGRKTKEEIKAS